METILLATDFSKSADSASHQAAHLAALLNTRLILLHIYQQSMNLLSFESFFTLTEKNKVSSLRKLYRLRDKLQKAYHGHLDISVLTKKGAVLETINEVAQQQKADLIVMGTMGERSPGARYFGSQATEMILKTSVPLLLVPPENTVTRFNKIIAAVDLTKPVDASGLDELVLFAQRFKATLEIVCVSENPKDPAVQKAGERIRHLMATCLHALTIVEGQDLTATLEKYEEQTEVDLLVLMPRPHNKLLFSVLETVSQEVARQSHIPVLALV